MGNIFNRSFLVSGRGRSAPVLSSRNFFSVVSMTAPLPTLHFLNPLHHGHYQWWQLTKYLFSFKIVEHSVFWKFLFPLQLHSHVLKPFCFCLGVSPFFLVPDPCSCFLHFTPSLGSHNALWGDDSFCLSRPNYADLGPLVTLVVRDKYTISNTVQLCFCQDTMTSLSISEFFLFSQQAHPQHPPLGCFKEDKNRG